MAIDTYASVTIGNLAVGALNPGHEAKHSANAISGDVVIAYDKAKVKTRGRLAEAVKAALFVVESGNSLTA